MSTARALAETHDSLDVEHTSKPLQVAERDDAVRTDQGLRLHTLKPLRSNNSVNAPSSGARPG